MVADGRRPPHLADADGRSGIADSGPWGNPLPLRRLNGRFAIDDPLGNVGHRIQIEDCRDGEAMVRSCRLTPPGAGCGRQDNQKSDRGRNPDFHLSPPHKPQLAMRLPNLGHQEGNCARAVNLDKRKAFSGCLGNSSSAGTWRSYRPEAPQVVVTMLSSGSPRMKRLRLSATSLQRRATMPSVQPEQCGVMMTFGNS